MTLTVPVADAYVQLINKGDRAAFHNLFAEDAIVDDAGRSFRGLTEIKAWSDSDIFDAQVRLEVLDVSTENGETVITTQVDGTFDRTGLPDPLLIQQLMEIVDGKIARLTCRLAPSPG